MKQASFKIDKISEVENKKIENLAIISTETETKNITSKKPIKFVENIYYFK